MGWEAEFEPAALKFQDLAAQRFKVSTHARSTDFCINKWYFLLPQYAIQETQTLRPPGSTKFLRDHLISRRRPGALCSKSSAQWRSLSVLLMAERVKAGMCHARAKGRRIADFSSLARETQRSLLSMPMSITSAECQRGLCRR